VTQPAGSQEAQDAASGTPHIKHTSYLNKSFTFDTFVEGKSNQLARAAAWQVAEATGVPFLIIDCEAPDAVIEQWLAQRQVEGSDPSDATMEVVKAQQVSREPLSESEQLLSRRLDTPDAASLDNLLAAIRQRLPGL
ncbi:MAG: hypothetical protein B7Z23_10480, partial [Pseudomonadales bacterium 32-61-5]